MGMMVQTDMTYSIRAAVWCFCAIIPPRFPLYEQWGRLQLRIQANMRFDGIRTTVAISNCGLRACRESTVGGSVVARRRGDVGELRFWTARLQTSFTQAFLVMWPFGRTLSSSGAKSVSCTANRPHGARGCPARDGGWGRKTLILKKDGSRQFGRFWRGWKAFGTWSTGKWFI